MEVTPALILAMWSSGLAGGAALVSSWRIVGPGYGWLSAAVIAVVGGAAAVAAGSGLGLAAVIAAVGAGVLARNQTVAMVLFALAGLGLLGVAVPDGGVIPSITGAVFLGGMTAEMMLGHWFLVDPQLPRWALQRLDLIAGAGLVADVIVLVALGAFAADDGVMVAAMLALSVMTALLVAAVWFSLRETGYSGVMAATGLSYLGVLTALGAAVVGRLLLEGM
jgi:hypothetical protein